MINVILDEIVESKKRQLEAEMARVSIQDWKQHLARPGLHRTLDFYGALKNNNNKLSIIGEIKKASPSRGIIKEEFDPAAIARDYANSDVQAVSVLTEKNFFLGSDDYLVKARQILPIPILRKDFIIDLWQIYQARYLGADAILLIAAILTKEELKKFQITAQILGMQCLVEVHNRDELDMALETGSKIIGINNRNLKTFEVDIRTTEYLINYIPQDKVVVSESGIKTRDDFAYLSNLGVDAVLIGESLMKSGSVKGKIDELRGY